MEQFKGLLFLLHLRSSELSEVWVQDNTRSVFLEVPIHLSHVIEVASKHGFVFHHARGKQAVLCKWLVGNEENKIPLFSNHTIGVAGLLNMNFNFYR